MKGIILAFDILLALFVTYIISTVKIEYGELAFFDAKLTKELLKQYGVVVLRGHGAYINSSAQFIEMMNTIGRVDPHISGTPPYLKHKLIHSPGFSSNLSDHGMFDKPATKSYMRIIKAPVDELAFGEGWHADLTYLCDSPWVSAVRAIELYDNITSTEFRDMRLVYNNLPLEVVDKLVRGMQAVHADNTNSSCKHDVIKTVNGAKVVFVNGAFTRHPVHHNDTEIFNKLLSQVVNEHGHKYISVPWGINDIVMWNNDIMQHRAVYDYPIDSRREIERVLVQHC